MENLTLNNLSEVDRLAFQNLEKIFEDDEHSISELFDLFNQENTANDKQKIHFLFAKYINNISKKNKLK
ncbi:MAG TPA: hypothetical protein PKA90_14150 [Ignavibacteria bacterium]|nr:hypothetical protein [Ignavibacteria bacterium]HMR41561.1 hypothetical protein [Ignavibacteria bacterium]